MRALEAELAFYGEIFGFDPADDLPLLRAPPPNLKGALDTSGSCQQCASSAASRRTFEAT